MSLAQVDTPALVVDLDVFEKNLNVMAGAVAGSRVSLRPHAKTHKCPEIARRQVALGAVGVCCQKVGEAEAMAEGGIEDIFITNEIVGPPKLARLARLACTTKLSVCVDDPRNVEALDAAVREAGSRVGVFIEINVGSNRCGVAPGESAVVLARSIASSRSLRFEGLQAYFGLAQHIRGAAERAEAAQNAAALVTETVQHLARAGIDCRTVTGGGTGTLPFDSVSGVYNEVQPGSYVFMDSDYSRNELPDPRLHFGQSLFVWTTVMSRPVPQWGSVDAGLKAISTDSGLPSVQGHPWAECTRFADEHGVMRFDEASALRPGDKLMLVPGHCDPTVNLHEWFVGVRNGRVEELWPITARGAFL
ncbi:MAG TPA: DSD1 family PLP-dependent enzyme [Opitutaceae bacterium]|jgi:D-serine deaminase-like pyridoxal phosphate-dependent protein|nr:DSD1 family PLP-dependent enzyme [Opitutaceae bacterium]